MDGGRRLLRPLGALFGDPASTPARPAARDRARFGRMARLSRALVSPRFDSGALLTIAVVGLAAAAGAWLGGGYEAAARAYGAPRDALARLAGFELKAITLTGQKELAEGEILEAAQLSNRDALPFIDAAALRERVKRLPMVREAEVSKLYPGHIVIAVKEREAFAYWQHEGRISVIARDGTVIDELAEETDLALPFVVGANANRRVEQYVALAALSTQLRAPARAGILVAGRRWTLRLENGVDVKLPEDRPEEALARLAQLDREHKILNKDILSLDMRIEGRATARLSEEAHAARVEKLTRKPVKARASET